MDPLTLLKLGHTPFLFAFQPSQSSLGDSNRLRCHTRWSPQLSRFCSALRLMFHSGVPSGPFVPSRSAGQIATTSFGASFPQPFSSSAILHIYPMRAIPAVGSMSQGLVVRSLAFVTLWLRRGNTSKHRRLPPKLRWDYAGRKGRAIPL